jgi:hypothetical protein
VLVSNLGRIRAIQLEILGVKCNYSTGRYRTVLDPHVLGPFSLQRPYSRPVARPWTQWVQQLPVQVHTWYTRTYKCLYFTYEFIMLYCTYTVICPDRPWGTPSLLYNGYRVIPGGKVARTLPRPPPQSTAEVKERVEIYRHSASGSWWPVLG